MAQPFDFGKTMQGIGNRLFQGEQTTPTTPAYGPRVQPQAPQRAPQGVPLSRFSGQTLRAPLPGERPATRQEIMSRELQANTEKLPELNLMMGGITPVTKTGTVATGMAKPAISRTAKALRNQKILENLQAQFMRIMEAVSKFPSVKL